MYQSFDLARPQPQSFSAAPVVRKERAPAFSTVRLFGLDLVSASAPAVARHLVLQAVAGRRMEVAFVNAHCVNMAARDSEYAAALGQADMLLPDGSGLRLAAGLAGAAYGDNLNGTDLFPRICVEAARRGAHIYLLGGAPGIAERTAQAMTARFPGLEIVGTQDGYFAPNHTARIIRAINASNADMVLVGMGVPLQECWLARHGHDLLAPVQMSVGGLFDYYSGRIPRAPLPIRKLGCEWIWRLAQEPRRLAGRYVVGNMAFVLRAIGHALSARGFDSARTGSAIKRAGDLAATLAGLVVLAPLLALIAAAIKLEDGGPVFFTQTRIGLGGRPFRVWKFRSMVVDAEKVRARLEAHSERDGVCFKMRRDPRNTRVGAILRRTSLDELPQLFNVVTGEMSLVGPRPALPQEVMAYWDRALHRLDARPGITCTWQVSGRAEIPFTQQVEMDIDYVDRHGPLRDLALLARTVPAVLTGRGAY